MLPKPVGSMESYLEGVNIADGEKEHAGSGPGTQVPPEYEGNRWYGNAHPVTFGCFIFAPEQFLERTQRHHCRSDYCYVTVLVDQR